MEDRFQMPFSRHSKVRCQLRDLSNNVDSPQLNAPSKYADLIECRLVATEFGRSIQFGRVIQRERPACALRPLTSREMLGVVRFHISHGRLDVLTTRAHSPGLHSIRQCHCPKLRTKIKLWIPNRPGLRFKEVVDLIQHLGSIVMDHKNVVDVQQAVRILLVSIFWPYLRHKPDVLVCLARFPAEMSHTVG